MIRKTCILSLFILLSAAPSFGQLWSGILAPSRAVDWTQAGLPGGTLPDAGWAQCVTTPCSALVSAGSGATVAQINAALASAPANTYVSLAAGTYNISSPIIISGSASLKNNVVLRGQGANSTFFNYSGPVKGGGCYGGDIFNLEGSCQFVNGGEGNVCVFAGASKTSAVTPGTYTPGSTYLSVASCGGTTPAMGSLSNLHVGSILIIDQLNEVSDTGTIWNCDTTVTTGPGGCAGNGSGGDTRTNGTCNGSMCERSQSQGFVVVGISGSTVQVDQPLYMAQWRTSQQPQAWFASNTVKNLGIENLSIDTTNATSGFVSTVNLVACNACWVAGIRSIDSNRSHIRLFFTTHNVIRDNYLYKNQSGSSSSYGYEISGGWNNLLENNITQNITDSQPSCSGACAGNVVDYNFDVYSDFASGSLIIVPPLFLHASGDAFNLWEGNIAAGFSGDNIHGTHHFETVYRNTLPGWQSSCGLSGPCAAQTIPITLPAGDRYMNIIGNVMGQAGYHNAYQCAAQTSNAYCKSSYSISGKDSIIYWLNYVNNTYTVTYSFCNSLPAGTCTTTGNWDTQVSAYLMRWANYDVVTGAARFCGSSSDTGWSSTCAGASEVPTGLPSYSNPVPTYGDNGAGQPNMPASFVYPSKPAFLGSSPWPVAGPEVTGGNLGQCSGGAYSGMAALTTAQCGGGATLKTAWAGHSNANAAIQCYLNTMGGPPDGSGSVLGFNANSCYGGAGASSPSSVGPPTNLKSLVVN